MDRSLILKRLESIASVDDFASRSSDLVDEWKSEGVGLEAVEPVLEFIERHPALDFGMPGALVHFVERFHRNGYDERLLASLARRPTPHTAWMLNRLINGTSDPARRSALISAMKRVATDPSADPLTVTEASRFLEGLDDA